MAAALVIAVALSMVEIFFHGIKPQKNIWVLILLAYIPIHIYAAPSPSIDLMGTPVYNFWAWRPAYKIICFGLLFLTIASHTFTEKEKRTILQVMVWMGVVTAFYEISQFFYTDQWMKRVADGDWGRIGGFINNPILTAPFVALCVPLAIYLRAWWRLLILIIGVILPDSQMAWIAAAFGTIVYFGTKNRRYFMFCVTMFFVASAAFTYLSITNLDFRGKFSDHERFHHWNQIFKDWTGPLHLVDAEKDTVKIFSLTGRGIGSFKYVYRVEHPGTETSPNRFEQAHNDYLEWGYIAGFVGVGLLGMALFYLFSQIWIRGLTYYGRAVFASLAVILTGSLACFLLQIGPFSFYATVLLGILHNPDAGVFRKPASDHKRMSKSLEESR